MITIYVIKSQQHKFRYVGITNNLARRLKDHNHGKNKSTNLYSPYILIHSEEYENYKKAREREKFLKSGQGRIFLDKLL